MKILVFSHVFRPQGDGGSFLLAWLAQQLKQQGHQVEIWASDGRSSDDFLNPRAPRLAKKQKWQGILVHRWPTWRWGKPILRRLVGPVFLWLNWWPRQHFAVVISGPFPTLAPFYGWFLARLWGSRFIMVPCWHSQEVGFQKKRSRWLLQKADKIIALSNYEKKQYQKLGVDRAKIIVLTANLARGIMLTKKQKAKFTPPPLILFLGSQAAHKQIDWLLEAFRQLKEKGQSQNAREAKLVIAGPRTLYSPVIDEIYRHLPVKIRRDVQILGPVSAKKKVELLDRAWVLVNPSRAESLSLVVMEAWARKKPVIVNDLPVLREVMGHVGGWRVRSSETLANTLDRWFFQPGWLKSEGEKGYARLRKRRVAASWWRDLLTKWN